MNWKTELGMLCGGMCLIIAGIIFLISAGNRIDSLKKNIQAHQQFAPVNQATCDAGTAFTRPAAPRPRKLHRVKHCKCTCLPASGGVK